MDIMYPAKINSPTTTLAHNINASTTSIEVVDASVFPTAPNLATLGGGVDAETVLYSSINGNILTCTRGFQGTAKGWSSGETIGRMFTAYDYDTLVANIVSLSKTGVGGGGSSSSYFPSGW